MFFHHNVLFDQLTIKELLTTHFMDEADLLCERIAILTAGRLRFGLLSHEVFLSDYHIIQFHVSSL
jgi:ABC-type multidrug transport system ATPase subunit